MVEENERGVLRESDLARKVIVHRDILTRDGCGRPIR